MTDDRVVFWEPVSSEDMKDLESDIEAEARVSLDPDKFKMTDAKFLDFLSRIKDDDESQREWEETKERWNKQEKFF